MSALPHAAVPHLSPMTPGHLDAVMAIELVAYPFPWTRGNFADSLNAGYSAWVAERGRDLIGYFVLMAAVDEAHLLNITVAPPDQGQGYGRWLLEEVMKLAKLHGMSQLLLEVRPSNHAALKLYETAGLRRVGVRRRYYPDQLGQREDAIVMVKAL